MAYKGYTSEYYVKNGTRKFYQVDKVRVENLQAIYTDGTIDYISAKGIYLKQENREKPIYYGFDKINSMRKLPKD